MRILLLTALISASVMANIVGVSTHPFTMQKQVMTTEFNSYMGEGGGLGLTARYFNRINEDVSLDAGVGIASGDRANRFFVGSDIMIFPDYDNQPRVSSKVWLETGEVLEERRNKIGIAPTISKGFNFWGSEGFPFLALPVAVDMNETESTYQITTGLGVGITGNIKMNGYEQLIGSIEGNVGFNSGESSIVMGLSLPLN